MPSRRLLTNGLPVRALPLSYPGFPRFYYPGFGGFRYAG